MPPHHGRALNLLAPSATTRAATAPQLRLAQEVSVIGALQGSLDEAECQGDTRALARLAALVSARVDKVAVLVDETDRPGRLTTETRRARIRELIEASPWLQAEGLQFRGSA